MPLYRHPDQVVLRVKPAAGIFLKAYTTNLIDAQQSAFLTREGKTIAVVRQAKLSEGEALLVIGRAFVDKLLAQLSKYLLLTETQFTLASDLTVYFDSDCANKDRDTVIPDKAGCWILSADKNKTAVMTQEEYTRFRVEHGIPEQGIDFQDELPLCIDKTLVDFNKGCYLGQEIVARVHYRGTPPKKLFVKKQSECTPDEFSRMTSKVDLAGEVTGFIFVLS